MKNGDVKETETASKAKPRRVLAVSATVSSAKEGNQAASEPSFATPEIVDGVEAGVGHAALVPVGEPEGETDGTKLADLDDALQNAGEIEGLIGAAVDAISDDDIVLAADALAPEVLTPEVTSDRRAGSLVKTDPLTVYMNEIRRYPLLSREEEHELAVEYAKRRDPQIARRLITANLRLVVKIAHEYKRAFRNLLDLVQEGNLGLLQAVEKYDPHRGVKLSSYAAWWIRAYMLKYILNNWRLVKIGTTQVQRKLFFNLSKERDKLEAAGFFPSNKLLAERLSVPEQDVAEMSMRMGHSETSLDAPVAAEDEQGRHQVDLLESPTATRPDVAAESEEFRAILQQKLAAFETTLSGRDKLLFRERLTSDQPLTLQDVGDRFGISRERARQLEARLLNRLKEYLKKELGDAVQVAMGLD